MAMGQDIHVTVGKQTQLLLYTRYFPLHVCLNLSTTYLIRLYIFMPYQHEIFL